MYRIQDQLHETWLNDDDILPAVGKVRNQSIQSSSGYRLTSFYESMEISLANSLSPHRKSR